jgi:YD repeat-containing protein
MALAGTALTGPGLRDIFHHRQKPHTTTFSYDLFDRLTGVFYSDASKVTYVYDDDGNTTSRFTTGQGTSTYGYDALNRLISQQTASAKTVGYGYDDAGNMTSMTDSRGSIAYAYDTADNLKTVTEPGRKVTTFLYDANNSRTSTTYPNGVKLAYTYINDATAHATPKLKEIKATKRTGTVISDFTYTYTTGTGTATDVRRTVVDKSGNTTTYSYDGRNELTHAVVKNSSGTVTDDRAYTYDLSGNGWGRRWRGATALWPTASEVRSYETRRARDCRHSSRRTGIISDRVRPHSWTARGSSTY